MNISRIALLSVLLTAPYACASEAPAASQPGMISQITGFVTAPFVYAINTTDNTASWLADKTCLNAVIGKITGISPLKDTCINKPALIGKYIVLAAAAYAAYQAYLAYNAQNDSDDEVIFGDEYAE